MKVSKKDLTPEPRKLDFSQQTGLPPHKRKKNKKGEKNAPNS